MFFNPQFSEHHLDILCLVSSIKIQNQTSTIRFLVSNKLKLKTFGFGFLNSLK
jgi:hypothetical protein